MEKESQKAVSSNAQSFDPDSLYPRSSDLDDDRTVNIYQSEIGDVGCVVWDAAIVLAKFYEHMMTTEIPEDQTAGSPCTVLKRLSELIRRCNDYKSSGTNPPSVVELGSGTGYVGVIAAACGASVTVTDLADFVPLMQYNIQQNQQAINMKAGECRAEELSWGDKTNKKYDLVLLADCIYYEQSLEPLVQTLIELSSPDSLIVCCHEERNTDNKPRLQKVFFETVGKNFSIHRVSTSDQHPTFSSDDIHINVFTLKS